MNMSALPKLELLPYIVAQVLARINSGVGCEKLIDDRW